MCAGCADDDDRCCDSHNSHRGLHCSDGDWMGVGRGGPDLPPNGCNGGVSCSKQCERQWSDNPRAVQHVRYSTTVGATHEHPLTHCHSLSCTATHSLPLTLTYYHSHTATHTQPLSHSHQHSLPLTLSRSLSLTYCRSHSAIKLPLIPTHTRDTSRCVAEMRL
jgi:hypothetical protein